jgi:ABC-2 type transport system ATP-binding protein
MIITKNLCKEFNGQNAVSDLNLNIPQGAMFGFLGPNGAGKTTTLRMLMGLLQPSSGEAFIDGINVSRNPIQVRAKVGYLPDEIFLYDYLSGHQFLEFVADIHKIPESSRNKRIDDLLKLFGLENAANEYTANYSFGMKKKLALAGIVIHNPPVLMLDEPFNGLDPQATRDFRNLLISMAKSGTTIIFSSHVLEVVEKLVTHAGIISRGELKIQDSIENFVKNFASLEKAFFKYTDKPEDN